MTDHYTEATRLIRKLPPTLTDGGILALAQVHATLALAEQQRIANLIALLPGIEIHETGGAMAQADGLTEIIRKTNHEGREYGMYRIRPDIALALRIETPMNNHMEAAVQAAATVLWNQDPTTHGVPAPTTSEEWEADTEGYIDAAGDVIEAALPHIRAMIAADIRAELT